MLLKQSTTVTIQVGPFLDATDGVTEETALTPGIEVSKAGGAFAARNSVTAVSHDAEGWYLVELNATDTGTLGRLVVKAHDSATHLPVWHEFNIVPANVYDSIVAGSDKLETDAVQVSGDTTAADNLELDYDGTGYTKTNSTIGTCTANTDMRGTDGASTHSAADVWSVGTRTLTAFSFAVDLSSSALAAIWDRATTALTTVGSIGKLIVDNLNATVSSRSSHSAADAADAVWDEARAGHTTAGTFGEGVIVDTNSDKTGYSISGTKTTLDALNDIAATAIVSDGQAIQTRAGEVEIVNLVRGISASLKNDISDGVWDEPRADHVAAGSFGEGVPLSSSEDVYMADIDYRVDEANTQDEFTVVFYKNDDPAPSGDVSSPTIQVIKRADGTDLIASTAMSEVGTGTGIYKYDEATNRGTAGEALIIKASATIDGSTRTFTRVVGRDSTA